MRNMDALIEEIAPYVHEGWLSAKRNQGADSRKSATDEELMVPYAQLSEEAKDLDRATTRAVLNAIREAGYTVVKEA